MFTKDCSQPIADHPIMKQIPNILTLLNLLFGCLAIASILQPGLTFTTDENGSSLVILPEQMYWASVFIGCAAVIDFLDGFVARLFNASSDVGCATRFAERCGELWRGAGLHRVPVFAL